MRDDGLAGPGFQDVGSRLRSRAWFDDERFPVLTANYLERYLNYGLTLEELHSGKPIIGIAQSGSDLSPCNRHHLVLAERVRAGIIAAGGIPMEFPVHPIQETGKRPGAALDRNLAYLGLVELLHGYPIDGVVLTIGCDKTTPAQLMAAATVNIPAIALSVGPMLNGWHDGKRVGAGTVVWDARKRLNAGQIDYATFLEAVSSATNSVGYCNTMGTASTMNALAEVLGMELPGGAAIPAAYRQRAQMAYETGRAAVDLVINDIRPSDIMTRNAFLNAIVVCSALAGSTNAPIHLQAIARHMGVDLSIEDWHEFGRDVPVIVNMLPTGEYLGEDFFRAGGVPAVVGELIKASLLRPAQVTVSGKTLHENYALATSLDERVISSVAEPFQQKGGFVVFRSNFFESAIMKTTGLDEEFTGRYLSTASDRDAFELTAVVFDGYEDYLARIDSEEGINEQSILVIRGVGPVGYPGAAEVVNMDPPVALLQAGVTTLACLGDGRQSGTSAAPSILNVSPEAAVGGGLALLRDGDRIRVDMRTRRVDVLVGDDTLESRRSELAESGGYRIPLSQTPWQKIHRETVGQMDSGMVIEDAVRFQRISQSMGLPRHSP